MSTCRAQILGVHKTCSRILLATSTWRIPVFDVDLYDISAQRGLSSGPLSNYRMKA